MFFFLCCLILLLLLLIHGHCSSSLPLSSSPSSPHPVGSAMRGGGVAVSIGSARVSLSWFGLLSLLSLFWVAGPKARVTMGQQITGVGDDGACLAGLKASLGGSGGRLKLWSDAQVLSPCNTSSGAGLEGVLCNNARVYSVTLNGTGLAGMLSASVSNCSYLQSLDVSNNLELSGSIPAEIGKLEYLTTLNLSRSGFTGAIPVDISNCIYLNIIDLSHNHLSGPIPGQLGLLARLKAFDVSNNELSGEVPVTLSNVSATGAPRFNASSFLGNKDLYGYPLLSPNTHGLSVYAIVGIGLGSGFVSLFVSFTAVCVWLRMTEQGYAAEEGKISQLTSEF